MQTSTKIRNGINGLFLVAAIAVSTVACKKDKDNTPEPTPPPTVSQKLKEYKTGDDVISFDFNATGDVSKVTINNEINAGGAPETYTVTYDAAKKIQSLESDNEKIVALYENGRLSRADLFEAGQRIGYTNYQFQDGQLKRATLYYAYEDDYIPVLEFNYTHNAAGNVSEMTTLAAGGEPGQMTLVSKVNYQYDEKANPLYQQRDLMALFWQSASKNNVTVEDHFDSDLQPEDKFVYTYQYHSNGLPKSGSVTQGLPGQAQVTQNLSYIYQ